MPSRLSFLVGVLLLAGCAVEHGNTPPERERAAQRSPHATRDSAGPLHAVFDRRADTVAPGVTRMVLRVVLRAAGGRDAARSALEAVAADARSDSTVAAVRVLGYLPPAPGHASQGGNAFVPFAYLEWAPADGWDALSPRNARGAHRTDVLFVADLPGHPGLGGLGRGGPR